MLPTDPYNAYYQSKIAAFKEEAAGGDDATVQAKAEEAAQAAAEKSGITVVAGTGAARAKVLQAPAKAEYSVDVPPGITSLDLDVIKLTAQFVARNGNTFLTGLTSREHSNPQSNFLTPTPSMFAFFTPLADAYSKVLMPPPRVSPSSSRRTRTSPRYSSVRCSGWSGTGRRRLPRSRRMTSSRGSATPWL